MKAKTPLRRQIFVLTPEEKKAGLRVAALALGLATQHYRAAHPRPPAPPTAQEQRAAKLAHRAAAAKTRAAHRAAIVARATPQTDASGHDED